MNRDARGARKAAKKSGEGSLGRSILKRQQKDKLKKRSDG